MRVNQLVWGAFVNSACLLLFCSFIWAQAPIRPTVTSLIPNSGPISGGITITVVGGNFSTFGTFNCRFGTFQSTGNLDRTTSRVLCPLPRSSFLGTVPFSLSSDGFTYSNPIPFVYNGGLPSIIRVQPNVSVASGGVLVTVYGSNFALGFGPKCYFGDQAVTASIFTSQTATCVTPVYNSTARLLNVSFTFSNDGVVRSNPLGFLIEVPLPQLRTISPGVGSLGSVITLSGTQITPSSRAVCKFGNAIVSGVVISSVSPLDPEAYRVQCPVPLLNSPRNRPIVEVRFSADGMNFSNALTFTYIDPVPQLTSVDPKNADFKVPTQVTIKGYGFVNSSSLKCLFGEYEPTPATVLVNSSGRTIVCTSPYTGYQLDVRLRVTNDPNLLVKSNSLIFSFQRSELVNLSRPAVRPEIPPVLRDVLPKYGAVRGGTKVTIFGSGFVAGRDIQCSFGNYLASVELPAKVVVFKNSTQVFCVAPPSPLAQPFLTQLWVSNDGGFTWSNPLPFRYIRETDWIQYDDK